MVDIPFCIIHEEKLIFQMLKFWQNYLKDEQMPHGIGLDLFFFYFFILLGLDLK